MDGSPGFDGDGVEGPESLPVWASLKSFANRRITSLSSHAESFATTVLEIAPGPVMLRRGQQSTHYPALKSRVTFGARFRGNSWLMTQIGLGTLQ